jgi:hypothetical protein
VVLKTDSTAGGNFVMPTSLEFTGSALTLAGTGRPAETRCSAPGCRAHRAQ